MSQALLFKRPSPFTLPGDNARFDPSHFAARGMAPGNGFSGVCPGGTCFLNLLTRKTGNDTGTGSPISGINGLIGKYTGYSTATGAQGISLTGLSAAPATQTCAAIVYATAFSQPVVAMSHGGNSDGLALFANTTTGALGVFANSGGNIVSTKAIITLNTPWFIAASANSTISKINFVATNLITGKTLSDSVSSAIGFTATGTYRVAADNYADGWVGGIAAAMYAPNFLSTQELSLWGSDPWSFWYPRTLDLSMMMRPNTGVADVLYAQILL